MAWTLDSKEVEIRPDRSDRGYYHIEDLFIREVGDMVFYGQVKDCDNKNLEGALLKVFARRSDGSETALTHAYSGKNGYYLINVPVPDFTVVKYIVRSSMSSTPPAGCSRAGADRHGTEESTGE